MTVETLQRHGITLHILTRFHDADGFILRVMGNVGRRVKQAMNSVPAVRSNDGVSIGLRVLLNGVAQLAILLPGFYHLNGDIEAFPRYSDQLFRLLFHLTHEKCLVQIPVIALDWHMRDGKEK